MVAPRIAAVAAVVAAVALSTTATPFASTAEEPTRRPVRVSTGAELAHALAERRPRTIVLSNGVFDHPRPFVNASGHRVVAAHAGRALLKTGFVLGGNWGRGGGLLRGVTLDVAKADRALSGGAVTIWGTGRNSTVADTRIRGNGVVPTGILVVQPEGVALRRVTVSAVTSFGIAVLPRDVPRGATPKRALLEDVRVSGVARPVPRSSNGTAEACLWAATSVTVRRAWLSACAWAGLWTGEAVGRSVFERIRVDRTPVGVYAEHFTQGARFRRLAIGPEVATGVNCEWADPAWGGRPGCHGVVIEDSRIATTKAGVYLDAGTTNTIVRRVRFVGQSWAGIGDHRGIGNRFAGNVFQRLAPGARPISRSHISAHP